MPSSPPTWRAYSYSHTLVDLFSACARSFRVVSTHSHACNLLSAQNELIALVDAQHGNGPFHIVIPSALLRHRQPNQVAHYANGLLYFDQAWLDLRSATLWEPR